MECPACNDTRLTKAGFTNAGSQMWKCQGCGSRRIQPEGADDGYEEVSKQERLEKKINNLLKNEKVVVLGTGTRTYAKILILSESESQDPLFVMKEMGLDPIQWELLRYEKELKAWDVTIKNAAWEGEKHTNHAYRCKVSVAPIQDLITTAGVQEAFKNLKSPKLTKIKYTQSKYGKMLEFPNVDFHLGNCDLVLSSELLKRTVIDIIARVKHYNLIIDHVLLQVGQDFFHVDGANKTTTAGTVVETYASWSDIYDVGLNLTLWMVDQFRHIAPVHVYYIPGNHDKTLGLCLAKTLEKYYAHVPESVTVDTVDYPRKYHQYGVNLIGMAHAKEEGKRIEDMMQVEAKEMWGNSVYREFHLGHLHHEKLYEKGGIIFRRLPTNAVFDNWLISKGFTTATKNTPAFIWDKELGIEMLINSHVKVEI